MRIMSNLFDITQFCVLHFILLCAYLSVLLKPHFLQSDKYTWFSLAQSHLCSLCVYSLCVCAQDTCVGVCMCGLCVCMHVCVCVRVYACVRACEQGTDQQTAGGRLTSAPRYRPQSRHLLSIRWVTQLNLLNQQNQVYCKTPDGQMDGWTDCMSG